MLLTFFIQNLILCLIVTIIAASLTLIERKVLSIVQRRVGPNYVGFRGRLQFIADALKLLLKGITIPNLTNKKLFVFIPMFAVFIAYTFWINTIWSPNVSIAEIEYNIVYFSIFSILFSFSTVYVGVFSRNKYSFIAAVRSVCMVLNLELMLGFVFLLLASICESFSLTAMSSIQSISTYNVFIFAPILPLLIVAFLLETNRAPFDLAEAESELVAGYTTELGGFFFALFYLGEYFHLFFFSFGFSIFFFGAWF